MTLPEKACQEDLMEIVECIDVVSIGYSDSDLKENGPLLERAGKLIDEMMERIK